MCVTVISDYVLCMLTLICFSACVSKKKSGKKFAINYMLFNRSTLTLPCPSTISLWSSSVDADPGFFQEVINKLGNFPDSDRDTNLVIDAMAIKSGKLWDAVNDRYVGFVDYGPTLISPKNTEATEALFFMLVALNGKWKMPVGYFLINKITAAKQGELILVALRLSHEQNIRIRSLVFDGAATNLATVNYLNARVETVESNIEDANSDDQLDVLSEESTQNETRSYQHYFIHPCSGNKVYTVLDPSHMVKLARNAWGKELHMYIF